MRENGGWGLFKGLHVQMMYSVPSSTVWLGVYWDSSNPAGHSLLDLDEKNTSRMFKFASLNFG